jgi:hypothetical protein
MSSKPIYKLKQHPSFYTDMPHTAISKKDNKPHTPYTYLIGWSKLDTWYYGVRYKIGCHPSEFWNDYKTSSFVVPEFVALHGDPDIIQIRQVYNSANSALSAESKVIKYMKLGDRSDFLNKTFLKRTIRTDNRIPFVKDWKGNIGYAKNQSEILDYQKIGKLKMGPNNTFVVYNPETGSIYSTTSRNINLNEIKVRKLANGLYSLPLFKIPEEFKILLYKFGRNIRWDTRAPEIEGAEVGYHMSESQLITARSAPLISKRIGSKHSESTKEKMRKNHWSTRHGKTWKSGSPDPIHVVSTRSKHTWELISPEKEMFNPILIGKFCNEHMISHDTILKYANRGEIPHISANNNGKNWDKRLNTSGWIVNKLDKPPSF